MSVEIATKDDFNQLKEMVNDLILELRLLNSKFPIPKVVSTQDICRLENISKTKACREKYYLPRFGESAYKGIAKWDIEEYLEWRKIPIEERKRQYQEMTYRKNQRVI